MFYLNSTRVKEEQTKTEKMEASTLTYKTAEALTGRHVGAEGGRRLGNDFSSVYLYLKPQTVWTD